MSNHAIVLGSSGINGWALVNQLLAGYPAPDAFSRVTAVARSPLTAEEAHWPVEERLQVVTGIDLLADGLKKTLAEKVPSVETVSHVYYAAYLANDNAAEECRQNKEMLEAVVTALEALSPALTFVTLITGTKAYGVYLLDRFPYRGQTPLHESLPRVDTNELFYYHQVDALRTLSAGKSWSWCEVRPDVIVGVAPFGNANCMAQTMGVYLSLFRAIEGPGARIAFPGSEAGWRVRSTDSNQDIIARFCIHASLQPADRVHDRTFNIADAATPVSWEQRWPVLTAFFGLEGVGPHEGSEHPTAYLDRHWDQVRQICAANGLHEDTVYRSTHNTGARMGSLRLMNFDRPLDLTRARELGFTDEMDTAASWYLAFTRAREAKILL
ncbi:hypothetical protein ASPZODRAFT_145871 [Penicilliopsis zonata CBS 506.65]|uniref:PRISE-like Rossmann-fold domain-containing protein n=1 Tax=Penicilliopsis zonata CBS 506.65 TaxID=1073090 RepID=A0A1L9S8P0_9EURO|nr:hypothetical protein ASPZODRAFT_145871 [Penicilliopsis zonata CBS 506.65]OJJ43517.1 hypothetical protein ASPZODRAFT_145871 [Penicilliopsis zonata CBS 506.65]